MSLPFLTAQWANLLVVNYEIQREMIESRLPKGVVVDFYENQTFVSLVAFEFLHTKVFGIIPAIPRPCFEEINLRYYVRAKRGNEDRKGVAFVKEFVPSRIIAATARYLYEEPYEFAPMFHDDSAFDDESGGRLFYGLTKANQDYTMSAITQGPLRELGAGSFEEFILEHYWGYTARADGSTSEYEVKHPRWRVWDVLELEVSKNVVHLYGPDFGEVLQAKPHSAFIAQGSPVSIHVGRQINIRHT